MKNEHFGYRSLLLKESHQRGEYVESFKMKFVALRDFRAL
jgi:hypothetical protein